MNADYGADNMPISLKAKLLLRYDLFRYSLYVIPEKVCVWIAWKLPRQLVMWCAIRVMSHATTGQWNQEPDKVTILDALDRWEK